MRFIRSLSAYALVTALGAVIGVFLTTIFVLLRLARVGVSTPIPDFLAMAGHDLAQLAPSYAALLAIAFAIAFTAAGVVARMTPLPRLLVFTVAGAVAVIVMLFLMKQVFFGVTAIAGARGAEGAAAQVITGALAGALFAYLTPPAKSRGT